MACRRFRLLLLLRGETVARRVFDMQLGERVCDFLFMRANDFGLEDNLQQFAKLVGHESVRSAVATIMGQS